METLYDLLGARADNDAEGLRNAFRKAAKANHPDLHPGDPDAPVRFREIAEAYDILRDPEQRAAYDRLLKFERERLRRKLKRTASDLMHSVVFDAVAVVGFAIVLGGGYTLFAHISKAPTEAAKPVEATTGRGPARMAAVPPAPRTDVARDRLDRTAGSATPFVLSAIASTANDGKHNGALDIPVHQADVKTDHPGRDDGMRPPDQDKAQAVEVRFSSPEKENGTSLSPSLAMADDKPGVKLPDAPNVNIGNGKIPETKMPAHVRTVAKRPAPSRTFAQASLENKSTPACSGSCSANTPPLFGVGF